MSKATPGSRTLSLGLLAALTAACISHAAPASCPAPDPAGAQQAVTYRPASPVSLVAEKAPRVWLLAQPDQALYRVGAPPTLCVYHEATPRGTLSWKILDGFGREVDKRGGLPADGAPVQIQVPARAGYYEVVVTLAGSGKPAEARRSIGVLEPPAPATGEEPFGLWTQGEEHYQELGVRWTRLAVYPDQWARRRAAYVAELTALIDKYKSQGITVFAYPKRMPKHLEQDWNVIQDRKEAWAELEALFTDMVKTLRGKVAAWGVFNEPEVTHWKGTNQLLVRYGQVMRRVVDRNAPGTPIIGPCLNVNKEKLLEQYEDLVRLGFPKLVDGLEFHPYMRNVKGPRGMIELAMPEDIGWEDRMRHVVELAERQAGRKHDVWLSEMGYPATYEQELAQAQFLVRSTLWAKKIGVKVLNWHMFAWPQGPEPYQRAFAVFRAGAGKEVPQPRPAGVAYGAVTRLLSGATFVRELSGLGQGAIGFEFRTGAGPLIAAWSSDGTERDIDVPFDSQGGEVVTLFGTRKPLSPSGTSARLRISGSPVFLRLAR